jgi:hypothetical protein
MFTEHQLLGDIGATNARFALLANGILGSIEWLDVARYARFTDAVADFLSRQGEHVGGGLFAVAGPVVDGRCDPGDWKLLRDPQQDASSPESGPARSFADSTDSVRKAAEITDCRNAFLSRKRL